MPDRDELVALGAVSVAGVALGAAIAHATRDLWDPPDCSGIGEDGGTVAGVPYLERMRGGAEPGDAVPMVIAFHSMGATPYGFAGSLKDIGRARLILPGGEFRTPGGGYLWWHDRIRTAVKPENLALATMERERAALFR